MSSPEAKSPPSVEYSQKYMSWHLKEINQSLKDLCTIMRSIDLSIKDLLTNTSAQPRKPVAKPSVSEEIPF